MYISGKYYEYFVFALRFVRLYLEYKQWGESKESNVNAFRPWRDVDVFKKYIRIFKEILIIESVLKILKNE